MNIRDVIPKDWPVQPLVPADIESKWQVAKVCGSCGLAWDDSVPTGLTPAPSARCPFEAFHPEAGGPATITEAERWAEEEEAGDEEPRTFAILALHADIVREDAQWTGHDDETEGLTDRERIEHLEGLVERLAAQVSELAQRLAEGGAR